MTAEISHACACGAAIASPLRRHCQTCEGELNRERVDRLRNVIRELKESVTSPIDSNRQHHLERQIVELDHPDPRGFLEWVRQARDKHQERTPRGGRR